MNDLQRKARIKAFIHRWNGRGYEKGETQQFWLQLLRVIGYQHADDVLFEHHLRSGGFIDVWIREAGVLIEQKALDVDLDKPELRQGKMKTPLVQALDYVDELPRPEQPRFVITCNFGVFRVYDRDQYGKTELANHPFEFTLSEFADHPEYLSFIVDPANSRLEKEKQVSEQAGEQIGQLYDRLKAGYHDPESKESMHALNVLCVRLVFCLYCEDSDLFPKDAFYKYLKNVPPQNIRVQLQRLFKALDTPISERDPYDTDLRPFPYVNGGLFRGEVEIPNFTEETKQFLLNDVSAQLNWSQISPTIFGGIFESTLNPETRRSRGMHYTSPENIHKVIDPLFLDDLKAQFRAIREEDGLTPRQRKNRFTKLHQHICSLKFLDPACGSGNFLTETYISLRKLEDAILNEINAGQTEFGEVNPDVENRHVSLSQFYGIEINDFAVSVAETALWISRLKANGETSMLYNGGDEDFPLHEQATIVHRNALQTDWNDVLPAHTCNYIMGNPPFVGQQLRTAEQSKDMADVFGQGSPETKLDYVLAWYRKAFDFIKTAVCSQIKVAFVSTNSICQGEPVPTFWKWMIENGTEIGFAYRSFKWASESQNTAAVYCVIVGFCVGKWCSAKTIIDDDVIITAEHINAYLLDAPDIWIVSRSNIQPQGFPKMIKGSEPSDGRGNLLLDIEKKQYFEDNYPSLKKYIRPFVGGDEYLNNKQGEYSRYCFWFKDGNPSEYANIPEIRERLNNVAKARSESSADRIRKQANYPYLFCQIRQPNEDYLVFPQHTTSSREYIPIGYLNKDIIAGNACYIVEKAPVYVFGILMSSIQMAWTRVVCGRLGNGYRYSPAIYNNFPWPEVMDEKRTEIEKTAQAILDARALYPDASLANLYDDLNNYPELLQAHDANDRAVMAAYGMSDAEMDEAACVAHLMRLYQEKTSAV